MELWGPAAICILAVTVICLLVKIHLLQKAADEIGAAFAHRLSTDTNTLIAISTRDRHMRKLAAAINVQLRRLRAQSRRFQQGDMELKNAVTSISHDLRTPLTAIWGYLDLLEQEEKSEAAARYLDIIRNRADMLSQLTEELFRYSVILTAKADILTAQADILTTKENSMKEEVIVNHILEESIAAFYSTLLAHHITPCIRIPEQEIVRTLDASALSRVFTNLLSNAVKYSDGDLDIVLSENGEITFSNSAAGLDQVQTGRLFDRFYTVESARNSTGLGLSIARHLTEQMGGTITARYEDGRLSIHVTLP